MIEQYAATSDARYFTNAVSEAVLGDGATLHHYRLQREGKRAFHTGHVETSLGRESHYVSFSFATGAALSRTNIYASLAGEGCGATLNGLYMLDGEQVCDHQTRIEHAQPNTYSREVYKGILGGKARAVFNGKIIVRPQAQKTDAKQTNKALLLSDDAQINTKPQLEIFADDVKCTHGAAIGQLDEDAMFYLRARGVAMKDARNMLIHAFAGEVLDGIAVDAVRDRALRLIDDKLHLT